MQLLSLLALTFLGSIAGLIGGVILLLKKSWGQKLSLVAVPFAAGVLLSVSILHLFPESIETLGSNASVVVLLSLLGAFFFEQFFAHLHHHDESGKEVSSAVPLVIFGDTIHNFIDGVAIASAFSLSPKFGLIVALASFLHETPHEIGDFGILLKNGWSRKKALTVNFLSSLATFPGALITFYSLSGEPKEIGTLLAISAGIFLYLGASDFLPEVGEQSFVNTPWKKFLPLVLGVGVMFVLRLITPAH